MVWFANAVTMRLAVTTPCWFFAPRLYNSGLPLPMYMLAASAVKASPQRES